MTRTLRRTAARVLAAAACLAALLASAAGPATAQVPPTETPADTVWLCRPGLADNPCDTDLTTTRYNAFGRVTGVRRERATRAPAVDCFYVYPTTSDQPTPAANFDVDPELRSIALYQAARYASECRVFAPVYRQITIAGLGGGATVEQRETAYEDVRRAWFDYLANDNDGRGVVFIGHSQGSGVLRRLLREEVDPFPAERARLVSAILLGSNVTVAEGRDVGGDFQSIPACRAPSQTGCVIAYVTFNEPVPAASRFGRTSDPALEVLCTNPASLRGGTGNVDSIYPSEPFAPGTVIGAVISILGAPPISATTPWVEFQGAYRASCTSADGATSLQVTPRGTSPQLNPSPDATWGLHLVDANIALGNLVDVVGAQAVRYGRR